MRFAIIGSRGFPSTYGGFETLVRHLALYAVDAGHDVTVYGRTHGLGRKLRTQDGVNVVDTPTYDRKSFSTLSNGLTSAVHAGWRREFDVALVLNCANGYFLPLLRTARVPVVVNVDGLEWQRGKWGAGARQVFRGGALFSARFADAIVFDSIALGAAWESEFGRGGSFIPYGADASQFDDTQTIRELRLEPNDYILVVARLVPENSVGLMIETWERHWSDRTLVVVGDTNYDNALAQKLRELASRSRLRWLGHIEDQQVLKGLRSGCRVYYHGHTVGGTNPSLLESLGAGAPTVAVRTPFNAEVLQSERQLIEPDVASLNEWLLRYLDDDDALKRMSESGRRRVLDNYQWPEVCKSYIQLLESVAAGSPR